jgi:hypothetical protein
MRTFAFSTTIAMEQRDVPQDFVDKLQSFAPARCEKHLTTIERGGHPSPPSHFPEFAMGEITDLALLG